MDTVQSQIGPSNDATVYQLPLIHHELHHEHSVVAAIQQRRMDRTTATDRLSSLARLLCYTHCRLSYCLLFAGGLLCLLCVAIGRSYLEELLNRLEVLSLLQTVLVFTLLFLIVSFPFGFGYVVINMAAGYLHGLLRGQALVVVTVATGFFIAFTICRSCLRNYARSQLSSHLLALVRVIEGPHGLKVIMLTRLTPIPFGMQNMMFAVTNVSHFKVLSGSVLGLLPTQLLNTYMGSTMRSMQEVLADRADAYIILSCQIIISILLSLFLLRTARLELAKMNNMLDPVKDQETLK